VFIIKYYGPQFFKFHEPDVSEFYIVLIIISE